MSTITILNISYLLALAVLVCIIIGQRLRIAGYENAHDIRHAYEREEHERKYRFEKAGPKELQRWFGLSRASWLSLPRVLMEAMPERWQADMAQLLNQLDKEFPGSPLTKNHGLEFTVQAKQKGKFIRLPEALTNYQNPAKHVLQQWRQG